MDNSRTKNSILNMGTGVVVRIMTLVLSFISRTVFIYVLGAEYLGLNGLFSNVLSFLALSELGLGSAIAFLLYKPIAEHDVERMKAVMCFYRKCYYVVGTVILCLGLCLMPVLKYLVNLDQPLPENLYLVFFLFVLQSSVSYFFAAYKQTFNSANQKTYLLGKIEVAFTFINCITDILVLYIFRNYIVYLLCRVVLVIVKNLVLSKKIDQLYPFLSEPVESHLTKKEIKKVFKDIYSVSVFRLGSILFNSVSNVVTSAVVGTIVVGYYSNYTMIVTQVEALFMLAISSISAGIGNVVAIESKENQYKIYKKLNLMTFFLSSFACICMLQLLNSFMSLWVGGVAEDYVLSQFVVILVVANVYLNCSAQLLERFKVAAGFFYVGRDLQVIGGVLNVVLSVLLAKHWGFEGVLISPFICKIFITVIPFVLRVGKFVFNVSYYKMFWEYISQVLYIVITSFFVWVICKPIHMTTLGGFMAEIAITVSLALLSFFLIYRKNHYFKDLVKPIIIRIKK